MTLKHQNCYGQLKGSKSAKIIKQLFMKLFVLTKKQLFAIEQNNTFK